MTKRQRYLRALRRQPVDELVWAPNFDYWLTVNKAEGTLPDKFKGYSRNRIVRAIGATIWNRASGGVKAIQDPSVRHTRRDAGGQRIHEVATPVGTVREVFARSEGEHRTPACVEHFVKEAADLRVVRFMAESTHYEPDYTGVHKALVETGEDGIVLSCGPCVPFLQFAKTDAGYLNAFYLWTDCRAEVDALAQVYFQKHLEVYRLLAAGPADVLHVNDNMDGCMISPPLFKEYAVPFYQEVRKLAQATGKILEGHWCGRTETLLPLVPDCGLDAVEAIVTHPMANITLAAALDHLKGAVALQGGMPSVLVCREGGSDAAFDQYLRDVILPQKGRPGFILGMADNVPPNADFARVERIAEMIG